MNVLGVERTFIGSEGGLSGRVTYYLDLTVDGQSLGGRFGGDLTALSTVDADFRTTNLRRLLGQDVPLPTFVQEHRRSRADRLLGRRGMPVAFYESAFRDGRVGLYYCLCGDVDCGVVSTRIETTPDLVIWHDVGWQTNDALFEPDDAIADGWATFKFTREQYDSILMGLLEADWSLGVPGPDRP